ncbi:MAG: deoxyribonuclease, partial [Lentilactobacillus hilgardii]
NLHFFLPKTYIFKLPLTNPTNYQYVSETQATANGATRAARGNQYARP